MEAILLVLLIGVLILVALIASKVYYIDELVQDNNDRLCLLKNYLDSNKKDIKKGK